ncbi:MAG: MFS transporter [Beutenbergiaceae bacterium]
MLGSLTPPRGAVAGLLIGVGLYFSLHTLVMAAVPMIAGLRMDAPTWVSAAVVIVYMGAGALGDIPVGVLISRVGLRPVVVTGAVGAATAAGLMFGVRGPAALLALCVLAGLSTAFLMGPLLGALASHAGRDQVRVQLVNAGFQRSGALVTSIVVARVLDTRSIDVALAAAIVLAVLIAAIGFRLGSVGPAPRRVTSGAAPPVLRSRQVQLGLIVGVYLPLLLVYAAAYFPLALLHDGRIALDAGANALIAREIVAILTAFALLPLAHRLRIELLFVIATCATIATLVAAAFVTHSGGFIVLFAVHGVGLTASIVATNVHLYRGTSPASRPTVFALNATSSRVVSVLYPLALAPAAVAVAPLLGVVIVASLLAIAGYLAVLVISRRNPSANDSAY